MAGGRQFFGYSRTAAALDNIYDAINLNTRASGHWKGKAPEFPLAPRPERKAPAKSAEGEKQVVTVADLYARFTRGS